MPLVSNKRYEQKVILDSVHDNIHVDPISVKFIDTPQFQRLREVRQLGLCHLVYPGATHNRLEHSLGVYKLARQAVEELDRYWPELEIEQADLRAVSLAGLLHDVGHGPFSHVFENEFLSRVAPGLKWHHEEMSAKMVDYIVDENQIDIDSGIIKRVRDLILCSKKRLPHGEKAFLFDIVANGRNSVDVDKFDYILRDTRECGLQPGNFKVCRLMDNMKVIDNEICYKSCLDGDICELFLTRANLFRKVYTHAKVKAMELMLADALIIADEHLGLSAMVDDPEAFWELDDSIVRTIETSKEQELQGARDLVKRMRTRGEGLYHYCNECVVSEKHASKFKTVTAEDIICCTSNGDKLERDDIVVSKVKIDLPCGKKNILQGVHFFDDFDSMEKKEIESNRVSCAYAGGCSVDRIIRVYVKKRKDMEAACRAFEKYQEEKLGQRQLHGTPERKKRLKY